MRGSGLRNLRIILWVLVVLAGGWVSWRVWSDRALTAPSAQNQALPTDTIGQGDYRLTATNGQSFTEDSLKGAPTLVFFGFTHCPDVCPMTMGEIASWKDELGDLAKDLRVVFVSVDPARDTPEILKDYVSWLPGTIGVTGTEEEVTKALKSFKIFAKKVPLSEGGYSMDHSAYVMLFDANGRYDQIFGYQENHAQVVGKLKRFLTEARG